MKSEPAKEKAVKVPEEKVEEYPKKIKREERGKREEVKVPESDLVSEEKVEKEADVLDKGLVMSNPINSLQLQ